MKAIALRSDALLLLTAVVWGFAFVAQRAGMVHVGPFTFNAVRFALGSLVLIPVLVIRRRRRETIQAPITRTLVGSALAGSLLFLGVSFQQSGLVYTTAGKAGFITGLYVLFVPMLGLLGRQRPGAGTWLGAICAAVGLYLLSMTGRFAISHGDLLVLIGAFCWAGHVLAIGYFTTRIDAIQLACLQFATCSILSALAAGLFEEPILTRILSAALPILYGGILFSGVGFTLQVLAQRNAPPAHAAIIMSLEAVFAVLGGWLLLGEILSLRATAGCALMLGGIVLSQLRRRSR